MSVNIPAVPEPIRSVNYTTITTSLVAIGAAVGQGDKSLIIITNGLNVAARVSISSSAADHIHVPAGATLTIDWGSHGKRINTGDSIYVRAVSSPASGDLHVMVS